jgi:transcription termination/antitermination protein NusA
VKLSAVIDELVEERGLDRSLLATIISEAILAAYNKKYPHLNLAVNHDKKTDEVVILIERRVVQSSTTKENEISVRKAKTIDPKAIVETFLWVPFEGTIGRIEILKAKQVIASKIAHVEAEAVYTQFKDQEGSIVYGVIHKCERGGVAVKLQETLAFLPKSLTIPGSKCIVGYSIRALLKEVLMEPRNDNQLILDRTSDLFLRKLFELEIPEVFEKLVEIKKIVRAPGYKSKVAVVSNDPNIDPVGTCVGMGGARIKPILKEIDGEKIDVIAWTENLEQLVKSALKPAQVNRVELGDTEVKVWLDDDQRSLAIGRLGKNITLASQLIEHPIVLMQSGEHQEGLEK